MIPDTSYLFLLILFITLHVPNPMTHSDSDPMTHQLLIIPYDITTMSL